MRVANAAQFARLAAMIDIGQGLQIDERELTFEALRASGPGGQHVNKTSTAIQLRFDVAKAAGLPEEVRQRLRVIAGQRMTQEDVLIIDAREHRSQQRNRQAALERLVDMLTRAARPPRTRRKTRPTLASRRRRGEQKRQQSEKKSRRRPPSVE